jgi:hypothetical protein
MGLGTGIHLVRGVGPQSYVQYQAPQVGGITLTLATAPDMGSADVNDKGSASTMDKTGAGYDAVININPTFGTEVLSGLNIFMGGHMTEQYEQTAELNADGNLREIIGRALKAKAF